MPYFFFIIILPIAACKGGFTFSRGKIWGFPEFIDKESLLKPANGLVLDDTLTIVCELTLLGDNVSLPNHNVTTIYKLPESQISDAGSRDVPAVIVKSAEPAVELVNFFSFAWTIENFSRCCDKCYRSDKFLVEACDDELKWYLQMYP